LDNSEERVIYLTHRRPVLIRASAWSSISSAELTCPAYVASIEVLQHEDGKIIVHGKREACSVSDPDYCYAGQILGPGPIDDARLCETILQVAHDLHAGSIGETCIHRLPPTKLV
jgi:hypothetical protein